MRYDRQRRSLRTSGTRRRALPYGRSHVAVGPVERIVGHFLPARYTGGEVGASRVLLVVHDCLRLAEPLSGLPTHRGRHGVVLVIADHEQRRAVILVEVDLGDRVWIEVGEPRLEEDPAGTRNVVAVVEGLGV